MTLQPFKVNEIFMLVSMSIFIFNAVYHQRNLIKEHPKTVGSKFYFYSISAGLFFVSFMIGLFCYVQKTISISIIFLIAAYFAFFCWIFWHHLKNRDKTK